MNREPGFYNEGPVVVDGVAGPFGHALDMLPAVSDDFTENSFAGGGVQAQPLSGLLFLLDLYPREPRCAVQPLG